jgi:hypothetical protein
MPVPIPIHQSEISREEAIRSLFTDEKYADLTLKGTDGRLVKAHRAMLAARSLVFDRMLYGDFSEASQKVVDVGYSGQVLQAIVEYINTDTAAILKLKNNNSNATHILSLMDAATYFELFSLRDKANSVICASLQKNPSLCVPFFAACDNSVGASASAVQASALEQIRNHPEMLLQEDSSIKLLGANQMELILKDPKLDADEYTLFLILQAWNNSNDSKRTRTATRLSRHIKLELIAPSNLATTVSTSGFCTTEQLLQAFQTQALSAEQQHTRSFKQKRLQPVWRGSQTSTLFFEPGNGYKTEALVTRPLSQGIHTWSILVEEYSTHHGWYLWLGVASTCHDLNVNASLGNQEGGWACRDDGAAYHNKNWVGDCAKDRSFKAGCTVKFILDLTKKGTLSVSINDKPTDLLFSDMLVKFAGEDRERAGFVPSVSMYTENGGSAKLRFLGFE